MIKSYKITGMTCEACGQIVQEALTHVAGVRSVNVDLSQAQATVETQSFVPIERLQSALLDSHYQIFNIGDHPNESTTAQINTSEENKKLIMSYLTAVGKLDYNKLKEYLHPDFKYSGASRYESASDFITMIKHHASSAAAMVLLKYEIKAIFVNGNDCCAIYDSTTRLPGRKVSFAENIKISNGKIISADVRFNRHEMKALIDEMSKGVSGS